MKSLKQIIFENLKFKINRGTANFVNDDLDEIWNILSGDSVMIWAGKKYSGTIDIQNIIRYIIHEYGRYSNAVRDTEKLWRDVWEKYTSSGEFTCKFGDDETNGALLLNSFQTLNNGAKAKIADILHNFKYNTSIQICNYNGKNNTIDIFEDPNYLFFTLNTWDDSGEIGSNRLISINTIFIVKKNI